MAFAACPDVTFKTYLLVGYSLEQSPLVYLLQRCRIYRDSWIMEGPLSTKPVKVHTEAVPSAG
jgi:hypothetical protein